MSDLLDTPTLMHYRPYFDGDTQGQWDRLSPETQSQWSDYKKYKGGDPSEAVAVMSLRPLLGDIYGSDDATVTDSFDAYHSDLATKLGLEPDVSYTETYKALSQAIAQDPRAIKFDAAIAAAYEAPEQQSSWGRNGSSSPQTERSATLADGSFNAEPEPVKKWKESDIIAEPPDWEKVKSSTWFHGASKEDRLVGLLKHREWLRKYMMQQPGAVEEVIEDDLNEWYANQAWNALDGKVPIGFHFPAAVVKGAITSLGASLRGPGEIASSAVLQHSSPDNESLGEIAGAGAVGISELLGGAQDKLTSLLPEDPVLREAFWTGKLPSGIGSVIGFAAGSALTPGSAGALKFATLGTSAQATSAIEQARALGREDKALEAAVFTAPLGALEGLGFKGFGGQTAWKIVKGTPAGQMIKTAIGSALKEGSEEALQEVLQGLGNTLYFHYSGITEGELNLDTSELLEDGAIGFIIGSGMGGVNTAINRQDSVMQQVEDVLQGALADHASRLPKEMQDAVKEKAQKLESVPEEDPTVQRKAAITRAATFKDAARMDDDVSARNVLIENLPTQVTIQEVNDPDLPGEPVYKALLGSPVEVAGQMGNDALLLGEFTNKPTLPQVQEMITDGISEGLLTQQDVANITLAEAPQTFSPTRAGPGIKVQNESLDEATGKRTTAGKVFDSVVKALELSGSKAPLRIANAGRNNLGVFYPREVIAMVRRKGDFSTGVHEAAHAIEDAMIGKGDVWKTKTPGVTKAIISELTDIGHQLYPNQTGEVKRSEGFAEYARLWLVDPNTATKWAPEFAKWFDKHLLDPNPAFAKQMRKAQALALTWQKQGSDARVKQHIYSPSRVDEDFKKLKEVADKRKLIAQWWDALNPLKEFVAEANTVRTQMGDAPLTADLDPYQVARAESMSHHQKVQVMVDQGMLNLNGEIVGPSLKEGLEPVAGKMEDFSAYLYARRALALFDKWGDRKDPGISKQDADFIFNKYHSPEFSAAADAFYAWWDGVLDYMAESSPDFAKTVQLIRDADAGDYIPLQREFDAWDDRYKAEYSVGSTQVGDAPIRKLKGSARRIKNPIMSSLAQAEEFLQKAHDKIALDQIIDIASTTPEMGRYVIKVNKELAPAAVKTLDDLLSQVGSEMKKLGANQALPDTVDALRGAAETEGVSDALLTIFAPRKVPGKGEHPILPVFRDGKVSWYQMDRTLYDTLSSNTDGNFHWSIQATLGRSAKLFRLGTTGLRPRFTLITNPIRDFKTFLYNTQSTAHSPEIFLTYMRSLGRELIYAGTGGKHSNYYRDFFDQHGLTMAGSLGQDIDFNARAASRLFDKGFKKLYRPSNWGDFIRDFLQFPESSARIAEIELLMKDMGIKPGDNITREQGIILANAAKQVTTDFTAGGSLARKYNQIMPFLNAQIQGPKAHLDALQRNPYRFIRRGIEMAILTAFLWYRHKDEEWWQDMSQEEKFGYTYIPMGDEMWRIPRAFQADGIFMSGTEALLDAAYRQDPEFVAGWFTTLASNTLTPTAPPILSEIAEQALDKDFFTNSPIVPRSTKDGFPADQYNPYTSTLSIKVSKILEKAGIPMSPARMDHAITGAMGGLGRDLSLIFGSGIDEQNREEEWTDLPLVGGLFQRGGQTARRAKAVTEMYDSLDIANKLRKRQGDQEPLLAREKRLILGDAATAISYTTALATKHADKVEARRDLMRLRIDIAKKAVAEFNSEHPNRSEIAKIENELKARLKKAQSESTP